MKTKQPLYTLAIRKGYTVTELMVSMGLLVLVGATAAGVFNTSQDLLNWNYHALALQKELRRTLDQMSREIRESSPSSPNGISPATVTPGRNQFSFQVPASISGNQVTAWDRIDYALTPDNRVTRTVNNGTTAPIGSDVQSMTFVYPLDPLTAPRTVQIQINGTRTTLKRTVAVTLTGQATLRNP